MGLALLASLLAAAAAPQGSCGLLDARTIARVQGHVPVAARPTERNEGTLNAQQCFFALPDVVRSVSLEVIRPASAAEAKALRERWERIRGEEKDGGDAEGREGRPARAIRGAGRPAVWAGSQRAGALYVLDRNAIVRVSVGGPGTEDERIQRSIRLAQEVLRRLRGGR